MRATPCAQAPVVGVGYRCFGRTLTDAGTALRKETVDAQDQPAEPDFETCIVTVRMGQGMLQHNWAILDLWP